MKLLIQAILLFNLSLISAAQININGINQKKIDRKAVVERHRIITTCTNPKSPAQVGNGEFAFGVDITGLQTFVPFNTLSNWSWHSFALPEGQRTEDFKGVTLNTHGRMIKYNIQNNDQPALSSWLAGNPHRFNLGRIGFLILKSDGTRATVDDLKNTRQEVDLWHGIIYSYFTLEGKLVAVKTACHPSKDIIGVTVRSDLIKKGQIKLFLDFPYPDSKAFADYAGSYTQLNAHSSIIESQDDQSMIINRKMDDTQYFVSLNWTTKARLLSGDTILSPHRFYLDPVQSNEISFTCAFSPGKSIQPYLRQPKFSPKAVKHGRNSGNRGPLLIYRRVKTKGGKSLNAGSYYRNI